MADENLDNNQVDPAPGGNDNGGGADPVAELTAQLETLRTESTAQLETLRSENATQLETLRTESAAQVEALQSASAAQLNAYVELARTLPGIVPELVQGETVEAVQVSLETAREAFNRIAAGLAPTGGALGAGGGTRSDAGGSGSEGPGAAGSKGYQLIYGAIASGKTGGLSR
jgi:hypothetical protein